MGMGKRGVIIGCVVVFCLTFVTAAAINPEKIDRKKFYKIAELIKLIEKAREAGISEEDLAKLELRDGDKKINVMDYMEEFERLKRSKDERLKRFLSKKFLTVHDIYNELIISEPGVIKKLREELVSER
jgi:hypothetical protein